MNHAAAREARSGFTLVELLVVMAVITILAALILPVVTHSVGHAKGANCISNLKQIGTGLFTYLKDNAYRFQMSWSSMSVPPEERRDWTACMLPYAPDPRIFTCPLRKPFAYTLLGNPSRGIQFPLNYGICTEVQGKNYVNFNAPSMLGVVADAAHDRFYAKDIDESEWGIKQVHKCLVHAGRAGVLFADWHAGLLDKFKITKKLFIP